MQNTFETFRIEQHKIYYTPSDSLIVNSGEPVPAFVYPPGTHSITVKGLFIGAKENCASVTKSFTTINNLIPADLDQVAFFSKWIKSNPQNKLGLF